MQILSCCPVVRDELTTLWIDAPVPGRRELISFEQRILWIRESATTLVLKHRGAHVDDVATFNDYYGFLTSLENREARAYFSKYKIRRGDALQIVATCTITDTPHLQDKSPDALKWNEGAQRKKYLAIDRDKWWFTSSVSTEKDCFGNPWYPRLQEIEVAKLENVVLGPALPAAAKKWVREQRAAVGA